MKTFIDCPQTEEGMIPCLQHPEGAQAKCYLTFCMDCGKDIIRDCEKISQCQRCGDEVEPKTLMAYDFYDMACVGCIKDLRLEK